MPLGCVGANVTAVCVPCSERPARLLPAPHVVDSVIYPVAESHSV